MKKVYVLFVVSDNPIIPPTNMEGVQHFVHEELELGHNDGPRGGWVIGKDVPHHGRQDHFLVWAGGETISMVVVNWVKKLVEDVFGYVPFRDRDKKQELN